MNPVWTLDTLYRWMLRPYLFGLDAESAHRLTLSMLSAMPPFSIPKDPPELAVKLWGIDFSNPVGLAAGMDKDALAVNGWRTPGFGCAGRGRVTPRPQPGHASPRAARTPPRG